MAGTEFMTERRYKMLKMVEPYCEHAVMGAEIVQPVFDAELLKSEDALFNEMGVEHEDLVVNIQRMQLDQDEEWAAKKAEWGKKMPNIQIAVPGQ